MIFKSSYKAFLSFTYICVVIFFNLFSKFNKRLGKRALWSITEINSNYCLKQALDSPMVLSEDIAGRERKAPRSCCVSGFRAVWCWQYYCTFILKTSTPALWEGLPSQSCHRLKTSEVEGTVSGNGEGAESKKTRLLRKWKRVGLE